MISPAQIRAARALLSWDAAELSKRSGIARATIFNIENGVTHGRDESLNKIRVAFDAVGVEFIENDGIRRRAIDMAAYEGLDGFARFHELLYSYLETHGGTAYICGSNYAQFSKYRASNEIHRARMEGIAQKRPDFRMKILAEEGDTNRPNTAYSSYRWMPRENFPPVAFYSFGDYKAEITFDVENPPLIILVKSATVAASYVKFFDFMWNNAKEVNK